MGLAPYGKPSFVDKIKSNVVEIAQDGSIKLNTEYFDFMVGSKMISRRFEDLFGGPARQPEGGLTDKEMDIAKSIQVVVEEILFKTVKYAVKTTGIRDLCLAGGVALNCVANGKILRSDLVDNLWIQPASGDAGTSLGAAFLAAHEHYQIPRTHSTKNDSQKGSLLGPSYSEEEILKTLKAYDCVFEKIEEQKWDNYVADLILDGNVVGVFQGRMEYGPRALGNRSILGDARSAEMQKNMNLKIKFRESFRPFAPITTAEKAKDWFELDVESPYMLLTTSVCDERVNKVPENKEAELIGLEKLSIPRSEIPAVTHVDYSARVQTVNREINPKIHSILSAFESKTECPVLINTSFNIRGEPIVCTPYDAIKCFMNTEMDVLILESFVLFKENQSDNLVEKDFKERFELD